MAKHFNRQLSWKQKLEDIKGLLNGSKAVDSITTMLRAGRSIMVDHRADDSIEVTEFGKDKLIFPTEAEWLEWRATQGFKFGDHILLLSKCNARLPNEDDNYNEAIKDGINWHERKTYSDEVQEHSQNVPRIEVESSNTNNTTITEPEIKEEPETEVQLFAIPVRKNYGKLSEWGETWGPIN